MIAIICGGADYDNETRVRQILDAAVTRLDLDAVIAPNNTPAGRHADAWAKERGNVQRVRPVDFSPDDSDACQIMIDLTAGCERRKIFAFNGTSQVMMDMAARNMVEVIEV